MYTRKLIWSAASIALASIAAAQRPSLQAQPITSEVKHAGVYHLSTGTWTRGSAAVALSGPERIYDNTCSTGFYVPTMGFGQVYDSGRIPSTTSPSNATSLTGLYNYYEVNGIEVGYCSAGIAPINFDLSFADCYSACSTGGALPIPLTVLNILNAPSGTATGAQACWLVGFDLSNTTHAFALGGDCNGVFNGVPSTDSFGWSWTEVASSNSSTSGPILAGDPLGLHPLQSQNCGGGRRKHDLRRRLSGEWDGDWSARSVRGWQWARDPRLLLVWELQRPESFRCVLLGLRWWW